MKTEKLDALINKVAAQLGRKGLIVPTEEMAHLNSISLELARLVVAADKVADAWFDDSVSNSEFADMMNAYRESRK